MNLVKTLDKAFSDYIRLRDADEDGYCTCVTCEDRIYWKSMDAGHYIRRGNMSTRWNEMNAHAQCFTCNRIRSGNLDVYRKWMLSMYGHEKLAELIDLGHSERKFTQSEMKELLSYFRTEIKKLKKIKNCERLF